MAFTAPHSHRSSSTSQAPSGARRCRSATHSSRNACWKHAWTSPTPTRSSRCRTLARLPIDLLTDGAPLRRLASMSPEPPPSLHLDSLPPLVNAGQSLLRLLASPNLCSRRPIFRRYDHMVGDSTVVPPGGDA